MSKSQRETLNEFFDEYGTEEHSKDEWIANFLGSIAMSLAIIADKMTEEE